MAPDADKLRQRKAQSKNDDDGDVASATTPLTPTRPLFKLADMNQRLKGHEIVIDGIIYDISDFQHPGGTSIQLFGGNDVTVTYKMIHPYHTRDRALQKMKKVGTIPNYVSEYKFDTPFEREIKEEVFKIVRRGKEFGTVGWYSRAAFYIALFAYLQYRWVTSAETTLGMAVLYGIAQAFIGLNVQHDANHGAASRRPWINDLLGLGADFIGGSKWLWMEQHWTHHSYTNHHEMDPDSLGAEPMILFNDYAPGHPKRTWLHHFQAFYYMFVLSGYWLSSVFNPQILDLQQRGALAVGMKLENDYILRSRKYAIALRLLYIYTNCIVPFQNHGGFSWTVLGHILVMGAASSLTLAVLFALSHNFEHADRDPTYQVRNGGEPVCWFKAQVETSSTYGGFISGCLTGGLNHQVEHHLFPRMSSAWYPYIAPTVRKVCQKHGVRYAYYPWVWQNLISTIKYLHQTGTGSNWENGNPYSGKL